MKLSNLIKARRFQLAHKYSNVFNLEFGEALKFCHTFKTLEAMQVEFNRLNNIVITRLNNKVINNISNINKQTKVINVVVKLVITFILCVIGAVIASILSHDNLSHIVLLLPINIFLGTIVYPKLCALMSFKDVTINDFINKPLLQKVL